jgi:hypothetical protein
MSSTVAFPRICLVERTLGLGKPVVNMLSSKFGARQTGPFTPVPARTCIFSTVEKQRKTVRSVWENKW